MGVQKNLCFFLVMTILRFCITYDRVVQSTQICLLLYVRNQSKLTAITITINFVEILIILSRSPLKVKSSSI